MFVFKLQANNGRISTNMEVDYRHKKTSEYLFIKLLNNSWGKRCPATNYVNDYKIVF